MEIRKDYRRVLTLEVMADDEMGYDEIGPFLSAMKKIHQDSKKIGFINRFSEHERVVLFNIWEKLKEDAKYIIEETDTKNSGKVQSTGVQG